MLTRNRTNSKIDFKITFTMSLIIIHIKCTYEILVLETTVTFLDTMVTKISDGIMSTIYMYCKSTDKHRNAVDVEAN